ncbi:Zinc finger protein 106 [Papilio xuthus]|uniref:Zinc finger protein 106 n=1 Tax=Papilio xuthus TaxID=66420 RepID=A0A194Q7F4_PAPXU|nr:Zinc finger protein 106 [Papilio xuthus]
MRRGHAGIGGWRNENIRHFRPRGGGNQQFRTREYQPLDGPRFAPPITRGFRPPLLASRLSHTTDNFQGNNRNKFRYINRNNLNRTYDTHNERQMFQQPKHFTHSELSSPTKRNKNSNHYDNSNQSNSCHINSLGDIDLRQPSGNPSHLGHKQPSFTSWTHPPEHKIHQYDERNQNRQYKYSEDVHKLPYPGHRPPSSDHYGGNPISIIENSKTYSRTVDDTVGIIRKRILDRNKSIHTPDNLNIDNSNNNSFLPEESFGNFYDTQQEQPIRRRIQRQKQKNKSNCDKIKNKIVHQLFKMDKEKIHKLMDNPNSSTKFEYAISSLITESQNSYNRHLRSVAEKSLCGTSTEFIQDDHNTIYEDTFLKQMQCILDPQDTVFLEDIKPFVMAELSKVLQLDDFEQQQIDSESSNHLNNEQFGYDEYPSCSSNYENYLHEYADMPNEYQGISNFQQPEIQRMNSKMSKNYDVNIRRKSITYKPNFEPRQRAKSCSYNEDRGPVTENIRFARHSLDNKSNDTFKVEEVPVLFDANSKSLSEDEDPFAELDNQYHVAVDPNFIADDTSSSQNSQRDSSGQPLFDNSFSSSTENNNIDNVKQEIDSQILNIAKSPLKLHEKNNDENDIDERENINSNINQNTDKQSVGSDHLPTVNSFTVDEICIPGANNLSTESKTPHTSSASKSISSNTRKRPVDQQSSHRKEKRKKSEDGPPDPKKKKGNKNFTNVPSKMGEPQNRNEKKVHKTKFLHNKAERVKFTEKEYSNKYVKRKNMNKNEKHNGSRKKNTTPSSHSNLSVTKTNVTITPPKTDPKNTLKTIDMFIQKPKKVIIHQAHRNTAVVPSTKLTSNSEKDESKKKDATRKILQRDAETQVHIELVSKDTQTTEDIICARCSLSEDTILVENLQMDPTQIEIESVQALNPLARMKEIDLQIQNLVEEKLKLYRSLGLNEPSEDSLQSLGIAILDIPQIDEDSKDENVDKDCLGFNEIIEEVVDIPISDLVEIANENTQEVHNEACSETINTNNTIETPKGRKLTRRQMMLQERKKSIGPKSTKKVKKDKSPNISLIEQILKDDRPLEEIITLDDFEKPTRARRKSQRVQRTNKRITKTPKPPINLNDLNIIEIRDCSVVLVKEDLNKLLIEYNTRHFEDEVIQYEPLECASFVEAVEIPDKENSDIQLDMLDVSEDITIDNNYEGKSGIPCHFPCIDNNFVAACLDGNVYYFSGDGQLINTLKGSNLAVTCLTIVKDKYETTIYTGSLDSRIRYYDLETGIEKGPECNVLSPIQTMDRAWDTVFVGTRTGFVLQFECKNNMLIPVSTVKFSDQSILALRAMKEGPRKVLLVASRAENVTIKDAQTGLLLRTLEGPKMTVYTLLYEDGKVYCGTSNHQIQVFDYTSGSHVGVHEGGKGAVCLRACGGLLFAGCYDGCVYVYREGETRPLAQIRGPGLMLLSLAILGTKIIAGFKDRSLCIWKIPLSILQEMIL